MKLYTEEQVIEAISKAFRYNSNVAILKSLTPIELPSDEEIEEKSFIINPHKIQYDYGKDYYDVNFQYRAEWVEGAKWVINRIKQQENEQ